MKWKQKIKEAILPQSLGRLAKVLCFLLVLVLLLSLASALVVPKRNDATSGIKWYNARGFYVERPNSLDYFAVGNSNLYCGIAPMDLWKEYGFTGYVGGEPMQTLLSALTLLQQMYQSQKPKLIILETDMFYQNLKADDIITGTLTTALPVIDYHNRWKSLTPQDWSLQPHYNWRAIGKGYVTDATATPLTPKEGRTITSLTAPISAQNLFYLEQIIKLCQSHNSQLLFVTVPADTPWFYKRYNSITPLAEKYGIPYVEMNLLTDTLGFDWSTDVRDRYAHLNNSGSRKVSLFLGDYLSSQSILPDHRGDLTYADWDDDLTAYEQAIIAQGTTPAPNPWNRRHWPRGSWSGIPNFRK